MIMGMAKYVNEINFSELPNIVIDNMIRYSRSVIYLSLTISCILSWERQVSKTISRVNALLYQLKICKHLLSFSLRI